MNKIALLNDGVRRHFFCGRVDQCSADMERT